MKVVVVVILVMVVLVVVNISAKYYSDPIQHHPPFFSLTEPSFCTVNSSRAQGS